MKEITIKVPDNTAYIHVLIGVLSEGVMNMRSCATSGKDMTDIIFEDEEKEKDG